MLEKLLQQPASTLVHIITAKHVKPIIQQAPLIHKIREKKIVLQYKTVQIVQNRIRENRGKMSFSLNHLGKISKALYAQYAGAHGTLMLMKETLR